MADVQHPRSVSALRSVQLLVGGYLAISVLTLIAIIALRNDAGVVNAAVWTRGTIVVVSALLTFAFARRAARGSRKGYLRLRIVSAVMLVAIVVIVSLPGTFPVWMKCEQAICGLLLLSVAVVVNGRHLRSVFR
jgi:O-antigen/teichoic acid export membrane protein